MDVITMACTTCPTGCALKVTVSGTEVLKVEGNTCKRGIKFAKKELVEPERMLTSTVLLKQGERECLIPVKSKEPIPKAKMLLAMEAINATILDHPVKRGDVIISDVADSGIPIVTCSSSQL